MLQSFSQSRIACNFPMGSSAATRDILRRPPIDCNGLRFMSRSKASGFLTFMQVTLNQSTLLLCFYIFLIQELLSPMSLAATRDIRTPPKPANPRCDGASCSPISKGSAFSRFLEGKWALIITAITVVVGILVISWVVCTIQRRRKDKVQEFRFYTLKELAKATNDFTTEIGRGGQGKVYKGKLSRNINIAVKESLDMKEDAIKQFRAEIDSLSKIRHKNVVRLYGCCEETKTPYLVYEFIPNGDVHHLLFNEEKIKKTTSWAVRHRIAVKVAEALQHLHSCNVLHRDIKGQNILLDDQLEPKLADFGLSKVYDKERLCMTSIAKGTVGYICPHYWAAGIFEKSCDVYSYGVFLIQLLTELPAVIPGEKMVSLASHFGKVGRRGLESILSPEVAASDEPTKEIIREVASLAQRCIMIEEDRPSFDDIWKILKKLEADLPKNSIKELAQTKWFRFRYSRV